MKYVWQQVRGAGAVLTVPYRMAKRITPFPFKTVINSIFSARNLAILLGIIALSAGYLMALDIPRQVEIDRCLDQGGAYDYQSGDCLFTEHKQIEK